MKYQKEVRIARFDVCPATNGQPTKQIKAGFERICRHWQIIIAAKAVEIREMHICTKCKGERPPEELTLIGLDGFGDRVREKLEKHPVKTGEETVVEKCESCGVDAKKLQNHFGVKCCPKCINGRSFIRNNPALVVAAYKSFHGTEIKHVKSTKKADKKVEVGHSCDMDRFALAQLANRMSLAIIKQQPFQFDVKDIELVSGLAR